MEHADLNHTNMTKLTLDTPEETITVALDGSLGIPEFMELVELLIVNAKYEECDLHKYIVDWAADIKATKEN